MKNNSLIFYYRLWLIFKNGNMQNHQKQTDNQPSVRQEILYKLAKQMTTISQNTTQL